MGDVVITTPVGEMPGYLSRPAAGGRWPGVVIMHDGFGVGAAERAQADWLGESGYLALTIDLCFSARAPICLMRMFRDLRARRGPTFDQVKVARDWLVAQADCTGRTGIIGFCSTGGFALLMAAGHGFSVSSVNYGTVPKDATDALQGACPIVASYGGRDRSLRGAAERLDRALDTLGIQHDVKEYPDAGHAFMHPDGEPSRSWNVFQKFTHAGYHDASARDARRRIVAFFDRHLQAAET